MSVRVFVGSADVCDATVVATIGSTQETLRRSGEDASCSYALSDSTGSITVTATVPGRESQSKTVDVPVDASGCHPIPQQLTFDF